MNNDKEVTPAKWQMTLTPWTASSYRVDLEHTPDDIKAKFRELYPVCFDREMAQWFGVNIHAVKTIARRFGIKKDLAAITKRKELSIFDILTRIRLEAPDRFAEMQRRKGLTMKKKWSRARREALYGMRPTTRLCPTPLPKKTSTYKSHMIATRNYFSVPEHPWWLCYDSQTSRSASKEKHAASLGLELTEGKE